MRLAFSTLGVPGMPVPEVARLAAAHGFHGVELRAHPEEPVHPGLSPAARAEVAEQFAAAGVEILTVASYAKAAAPGDDAEFHRETGALLELAHDLGASCLRVFPGGGTGTGKAQAAGGGTGTGGTGEADATAVRRLSAVAPLAAGLGVRVLLETHDSHRGGADAARVLREVGSSSVGALWDVLGPWLEREEPADTLRELAPHLGYLQVKDVASAEDLTPLPPGAGVLPLTEVTELLSRAGWDGWLCWEYEKRWYPQVPELATALTPVREHLMRLLASAA